MISFSFTGKIQDFIPPALVFFLRNILSRCRKANFSNYNFINYTTNLFILKVLYLNISALSDKIVYIILLWEERLLVKKAFKALFRYIKYTDKIILFLCICCSVLSVVLIKGMLNSDMPYVYPRYVQVQIVAGSLGILSAIIISFLDYHLLAKLWRLYVPIVLVLVLLTFFIGTQRGEADDKAWLPLPFGMSLQPSEFMKMAFILTFSLHMF